jgi:saccharopine dehydrogenase-like NADP-dependent oxidoreductase
MKIALFGTGRMGRAIVYMIKYLGDHTVHTWDTEDRGVHGSYHTTCNIEDITSIDDSFDLVISALPYYLNFSLAKLCIEKKIPYCDLGGSVPVSDEINEIAERHGSTVFTDLGLAPGWANILAEEALKKIPRVTEDWCGEVPHTIKMRCGGLPAFEADPQVDPFNYILTWSTEGLYNEYFDRSFILENGEIISVPSLSKSERVEIDGFPELEAFTTSGGASHTLVKMQERGVQNCSYKTLRYKRHLDLVVYFLRHRKFTAEQMASLFCTGSIEDVVIVEVEAVFSGLNLTYRNTKIVETGDGYTAMQRATAGGLVSAIFASPLDHGSSLTYADVDIDVFNANMESLKI